MTEQAAFAQSDEARAFLSIVCVRSRAPLDVPSFG
jgi:hypothetical protein